MSCLTTPKTVSFFFGMLVIKSAFGSSSLAATWHSRILYPAHHRCLSVSSIMCTFGCLQREWLLTQMLVLPRTKTSSEPKLFRCFTDFSLSNEVLLFQSLKSSLRVYEVALRLTDCCYALHSVLHCASITHCLKLL